MRTNRQSSIPACLRVVYFGIAILSLVGFCFGKTTISLSTAVGPPTTKTQVSGRGFAPSVKIDVYFDSKTVGLATANSSGSFLKLTISVPKMAQPGNHTIKAVERVGTATATATFLVRTDWAQFHRRNMQRWNPYENALNINNVGRMQLKWSFTSGAFLDSSPAVANGVIYFGSYDHNVYAVNASTGAKLWTFTTGNIVDGSPAVVNGVVYVASSDSNVYALDANTGSKLWSYAADDIYLVSTLTVVNGVLYVGADHMYALDATTGTLLWTFDTSGYLNSSPVVTNGSMYFGSWDHNIYALNAKTGALQWTFATGNTVEMSPSIADGIVYVGSDDCYMYGLNASTGVKLWSYKDSGCSSEGYFFGASPAVANGAVYFLAPDPSGNVYALNSTTGALLWSQRVDSVSSSPALANGVLYVGAETLYAFNASTGAVLWSDFLDTLVNSSPIVADGVVYFAPADGIVRAFAIK